MEIVLQFLLFAPCSTLLLHLWGSSPQTGLSRVQEACLCIFPEFSPFLLLSWTPVDLWYCGHNLDNKHEAKNENDVNTDLFIQIDFPLLTILGPLIF